MTEKRQSPETFLTRAKEEEAKPYGKLKIYLGAAPGVGKTYSMLEDALARREQGLDVVAGVVESHGRNEIETMLKRFEILPRRLVEYHGKSLFEFDLDQALSRAPGLILIDEMAHTNVPGLRHAKRWQDIKELLDRGINVYTALNVQHIESLNDIIVQIAGIRVRETVPDSMLEMADTIELVDLSPDDLLKRLHEGKVYIPAQAELATQHFFRKGNLIALRELALRVTAERVDEQVLSHRRGQGIEQTWPTTERLLVCVGPTAGSAKGVRAARRLASALRAEWIALYVETPALGLAKEQRQLAIQNLRLAETLGAKTHVLTGIDVAKAVITFAREQNVTKIVISKPKRSRFREFLWGSLVDALVREGDDIDIYIIRGEADSKPSRRMTVKGKIPWRSYGFSLVMVAFATAIDAFLFPLTGASNLVMVYLLAVVIVALSGYTGPSILASVLGTLSYTFFFIEPRFNFSIADTQYLFMLPIMLTAAYVISHLTVLTEQQSEIAHRTDQRAAALHALTRQLASTRGIDKLLEIAEHYIAELFDSEVMTLLPENNQLVLRGSASATQVLTAKEQGVAQWVYDLGQIAGLGTDTLPFSDALYIPLLGSHGSVGVLKVRPRQPQQLVGLEQLQLLEDCANQVALALEVDRLQEKARETRIAIETERLRTALFNSLSHELQNPLAVIVHLIHNLKEKTSALPDSATQALIQDIDHEAGRLNRLINNLLQITHLEEGTIKLNKKPASLNEVINVTLSRIEKKLKNKPYAIKLPSDLPLIPFDKVLMEQVLVNLIENAILYTPLEAAIEISASLIEEDVLVSVADRGQGLKMADVNKVFEKFYRGQTSLKKSGSGLGLSVCQSIIRAHGGRIWAENRWDGGAIFCFILPVTDTKNK